MSRRSRRNNKSQKSSITFPTPLLLGVIGFIIVGFFASKFFSKQSSGSYSGVAILPVPDYIENCLSYRNGEYQLQGEITEKPKSDTENGQLIFVRVENKDGSDVEEVSIKVPNNVGKVNLETKHDYIFKVEVVQNGFLIAKDFQPL